MTSSKSASAKTIGLTHDAAAKKREPILVVATRALVHAITAFVAVYPLARVEAAFVAAIFAFIGAIAGGVLARSKLRLLWTPLVMCVLLVSAPFCAEFVTRSLPVAEAAKASHLGDIFLFSYLAFCLSCLLRFLSGRYRFLGALEVAAIGAAFAQLVIAHRNGAINRPFNIADPIISQGGDPTFVFLAIGAAALVVMILYFLSERRIIGSAVQFVVALIAMVLIAAVGIVKTPTPDPQDSFLGASGSKNKGNGGGKGKKRQGKKENDDMLRRQNQQASQPRPSAVVVFEDDYEPNVGLYYFRQAAFSHYNGSRLVQAARGDVDRDIAHRFPSRPFEVQKPPTGFETRQEVKALYALLADTPQPIALEGAESFGGETNPNPALFRYVYTATSRALTLESYELLGMQVGDSAWSDEVRAHYTAAPSDPRFEALATRILKKSLPEDADIDDPIYKTAAVVRWLGQNGSYTRRNMHATAADPLASFLFGNLTGYCTHFSHAAVSLLRTMGIPARVATGYAVEASRRQGGSALLIMGGDAHAWPEVYVDGVGWVVMDIAVQNILDAPTPPTDVDLQKLLAELARGKKAAPPEFSPAAASLGWLNRAWSWFKENVLDILLFTLIAIFSVLYARKFYAYLAPAFRSGKARTRAEYRAALERLSELGYRRHFGESRHAFAQRISAQTPTLEPLTDELLVNTFANEGVVPTEHHRHRQIKREIARHSHWLRRTLAIIDPVSSLFAR